jgi:hypothetical protein
MTFYFNPVLFFPESTREGQPMEWHSNGFNHDIDFNAPGTYLVTIIMGPPEKRATFEIQVVTQEEYDAMMAQGE